MIFPPLPKKSARQSVVDESTTEYSSISVSMAEVVVTFIESAILWEYCYTEKIKLLNKHLYMHGKCYRTVIGLGCVFKLI